MEVQNLFLGLAEQGVSVELKYDIHNVHFYAHAMHWQPYPANSIHGHGRAQTPEGAIRAAVAEMHERLNNACAMARDLSPFLDRSTVQKAGA